VLFEVKLALRVAIGPVASSKPRHGKTDDVQGSRTVMYAATILYPAVGTVQVEVVESGGSVSTRHDPEGRDRSGLVCQENDRHGRRRLANDEVGIFGAPGWPGEPCQKDSRVPFHVPLMLRGTALVR
jgi:hypothetical protein